MSFFHILLSYQIISYYVVLYHIILYDILDSDIMCQNAPERDVCGDRGVSGAAKAEGQEISVSSWSELVTLKPNVLDGELAANSFSIR